MNFNDALLPTMNRSKKWTNDKDKRLVFYVFI